MAFAPFTVQCMPARLSRVPTTTLQSVLLRRVAEPSDSVPRFLIGRSADFVNGTTPHKPDVFCARIFRSKADVFVSGSEKQERDPREDDANVDSLYVQ
jgi:hypothetical protein